MDRILGELWTGHDRRHSGHSVYRVIFSWFLVAFVFSAIGLIALRQIAVIERQRTLTEDLRERARIDADIEARIRVLELESLAAKKAGAR